MQNFEIDKETNSVLISINPKIYPLDIIYSAAYIFTENCYVLLDGNPEDEVIVELKPKNDALELEKIAREFNNELITYANYAMQSLKNARIREIILQRALMTNLPRQDSSRDYLEKEAKPWKVEKDEENRDKPETESS